ncbi:MAG: LysM peptidoglycan-binding domain-containing protein [Pirellulaceae bacterium]
MQTIKTAFVTVLLLVVLYGAYVAINTPPVMMPDELEHLIVEQDGLQIDDGAIDVPEIEVPPFGNSFAGTVNDTDEGVVASLSDPRGEKGSGTSTDDIAASLPPINFGATSSDSASANTPDSESADAMVSQPPLMTMALPKPDGNAPIVQPDRQQDYPETPLAGLSLSGPGGLPVSSDPPNPNASAPVEKSLSDFGSEFSLPESNDPVDNGDQASASPAEPEASGIENAIRNADRQVAAGELREALFTLSLFYGSPDLTPEEVSQLMPRLNALAGEVVYSRRHLIESAYRVEPGDTLETIAAARRVPAQVLANINGITDPAALTPGTELKVLTGPFRAEINLTNTQLALFLGDLYAGSFPIRTGTSPAPVEGTFVIQEKQKSKAYIGVDGTTFASGDPRNPYGEFWLDLGNRLSIHASPSMQPGVSGLGCIQMNTADARDIFGILSEGSAVTIRR